MSTEISTPPVYVLSDNNYEMLRLKKDIGTQFIQNVQNILTEEDINFTGDLSDSLSLVIVNNDVSVETNNIYALSVEFGLPAGKYVNFNALADWVRIKLQVPEEQVDDVTWKILRKIQKDGIKPKRFWKRSILKLVKMHGVKSVRSKGKKPSKFKKVMKSLKSVYKKVRKVTRFLKKNTAKRYKS